MDQSARNDNKSSKWYIVIVIIGIILFYLFSKETKTEVSENNSFTNESQGLQSYYDSMVETDMIEWTKEANEANFEQLCLTDPECNGNNNYSFSNPTNNNGNSTIGCPSGCADRKSGCEIKGNISFETNERIYHLPGMTFYDGTVVNANYGERWFCTESEAIANGWRKADN